jgi:hypothetical protein
MKLNALFFALLGGLLLVTSSFAQEPIADTRTALQKWVETRQLTSKLRADWAADKELLLESIKMFEREVKNLDELIAKVDTGNGQVAKERSEQEKLEAQYKETLEKVKALVLNLEKKTLTLSKTFPPPLAEKLDTFVKRIPEDAAATKLTAGQRLQPLVAILSEADKFNNAITVASELRKNEAGNTVQVRTMYLGLSQAYFTDKEGKFAGVGTAGADGWKWANDASLAPVITKAIAVYENEQPAAFVSLPAKIQ